jgi:D-tyrosyl-tRNA(Tyr) deacylase
MRLIVTSQKDIAGMNVYKMLSQNFGFNKIGEFEGQPVYERSNVRLIATKKGQVEAEHLDKHFSPDYFVFASRHRSVSEQRTLTVHSPGNLTEEAKVGGQPKELAYSAPGAVKVALQVLQLVASEKNLDYQVSMEVTHHGPTGLSRPVLFVEVGSTEREWNDPLAVSAVSKAALAAAENDKTYQSGIGVGGNHYAPRHTRFILNSKDALGHLIPSYALDTLDLQMFQQAAQKSNAEFCFLDWKGMKRLQREKVLALATELGLDVRRNISQSGGDKAAGSTVYKVNKELFSIAEKTDSVRLREEILKFGGVPVVKKGHLTYEFSAPSDIRSGVLRVCMEILAGKKPAISGKFLVLEEQKFDLKKAEVLGLKPGPEFATLKKGASVNAGGQTIKPEDVVTLKKKKVKLDFETLKIIKNLALLRDSGFN